jgi:hypothetical protein
MRYLPQTADGTLYFADVKRRTTSKGIHTTRKVAVYSADRIRIGSICSLTSRTYRG